MYCVLSKIDFLPRGVQLFEPRPVQMPPLFPHLGVCLCVENKPRVTRISLESTPATLQNSLQTHARKHMQKGTLPHPKGCQQNSKRANLRNRWLYTTFTLHFQHCGCIGPTFSVWVFVEGHLDNTFAESGS